MQKGSILFYHDHIKNNIDKVDKRTQVFIKRRKQFLRQYCQPLQEKIQKLDKQIDFYNHLIKNQNEMIENEEQVSQLKRQIGEYLDSQKYFLTHLEEYRQMTIRLTTENKIIEAKIARIKKDINGLAQQKAQQVYVQLSERDTSRSVNIRGLDIGHAKISYRQHRLSESKVSQNKTLLPAIFKIEKYYVNKQSSKRKIGDKEGKIMVGDSNGDKKSFRINQEGDNSLNNEHVSLKTFEKPLNQQSSSTINPSQQKQQPTPIKHSDTTKQQTLKQRFKQIVTGFNKFELLFKQCFEKKKSQVQRSVRQLQSKLITNRERFLEVCQAISLKDINKLPFELFQTLSGDQLMTLMISYPWIQKLLFNQLTERKKKIIELQLTRSLS